MLVICKSCFFQHIDHIRVIFGRLRTAGIKANYPEYSFGLKDIPYLGYIIILEGIKPDPIKVKGIMNLWQPNRTTEARALISMVH